MKAERYNDPKTMHKPFTNATGKFQICTSVLSISQSKKKKKKVDIHKHVVDL